MERADFLPDLAPLSYLIAASLQSFKLKTGQTVPRLRFYPRKPDGLTGSAAPRRVRDSSPAAPVPTSAPATQTPHLREIKRPRSRQGWNSPGPEQQSELNR